MPLKEIYKASSLADLECKATLPVEVSRSSIRLLISSSRRMAKEGDNQLRIGDEEMAYIYFMKYYKLFELVKPADQGEYCRELGQITTTVIEKIDKLKTSLAKRYKIKNDEFEKRQKLAFQSSPSGKSPVSTFSSNKSQDDNPEGYSFIDSKSLVEQVESQSHLDSILIIDVREEKDFQDSAITANRFRPKCSLFITNVPGSLIQSGDSYPTLDRKLANYRIAREILDRRSAMKMIVIVDGETSSLDEKNPKSPCFVLSDILLKWDVSVNKVKVKPKILKGGFLDFIARYPMYVTNPSAICPTRNGLSINMPTPLLGSTAPSLNSLYDFGDFGVKTITKPKLPVELPATPPSDDEPSMPTAKLPKAPSPSITSPTSNGFIASNGFATSSSAPRGPGMARPVIDRSCKPSLSTSNEDVEMKSQEPETKLYPSSSSLKACNITNGFKTSFKVGFEDDDEMVAGRFDDIQRPVKAPSTPVAQRKQINAKDVEMSSDDEENLPPVIGPQKPNSIQPSKPISMPQRKSTPFGTPSSLSRSVSSPNVAQFDEMEMSPPSLGTSNKMPNGTPLIDRSLKPNYSITPKRYEVTPKDRDFSLQYTSKYGLPAGLRNLGNTCFMNAVLQCLNNTTDLVNYLRSGNVHINKRSKFGTNGELAIEFLELVKLMTFPSNYKSIAPRNLKDSISEHIPDFSDYKQQDAHEFLVRFLDRIHADMNENEHREVVDPTVNNPNYYDELTNGAAARKFWNLHMERNQSIVSRLFEGLTIGIVKCNDCDYTSKSLEAFTCLSVPVSESSGLRTSIQASLDAFLKKEQISSEWQCPRCREKRSAEKGVILWRLPKYLVIHLKRFSFDGLWRRKITTFVDFPIDGLEIHCESGEVSRYNLYGVVNHSGSLDGGHYIAYSRAIGQFDWHRYDDQDVTPATAGEVVTSNAYVLFYQMVQ